MARVTKSLPGDANFLYLPSLIREAYPELGPDYYLDLWPVAPSILMIGSPEVLHQASNKHVLDKNGSVQRFLKPLTNNLDIVSLNGPVWKQWRAVFNPGFSAAHIMKLVPLIVRDVQVYCELLDEHVAEQGIFAMKSLTDNLILDIIAQISMGVRLDCQKSFNQFVYSLRTQLKWLTSFDQLLLDNLNPLRPLVHWYHGRTVNRFVSQKLDQRINAWQADQSDAQDYRTVTDLALNAYTESQSNNTEAVRDPHFKQVCMSQLKIFLFAGHDTTSSATCFTFWLLSQNLDALARLQEEHAQVFGSDPSNVAARMTESPHLLNQLPYTTAVIKESLRLCPPTFSTRGGRPETVLVDAKGRAFPTGDEKFIVWSNQRTIQRDPAYWARAEEFLPERFLVGPEDPLYPLKGTWRPFETGPRNCIGQELVMLEMKIVLVSVARTYAITPAYDEVDAKEGHPDRKVMGSKAYHVESMQPRGNLPVRVSRLHSV